MEELIFWKELNEQQFGRKVVERRYGVVVKRQGHAKHSGRSYQTRKQRPRQRIANRHAQHSSRGHFKSLLLHHPENITQNRYIEHRDY